MSSTTVWAPHVRKLSDFVLRRKPQFKKNSVIVITGASSGIGRELAIQYSKRKCRLVLAARSQAQLVTLCQRCRANGSEAIAVVTDVTVPEACRNLFEQAITAFGVIDTVVLNAGVGCHNVFLETDDFSAYETLMRVNFFGYLYCTKYAYPYLSHSKGLLVVISSLSGELGLPYRTAYCASKFAVTGFFESLRAEIETESQRTRIPPVDICLVCPPTVRTGLRAHAVKASAPGSSRGTPTSTAPNNKAIDVLTCVNIIMDAADRRLRKVFFPASSFVAVYLRPFFPDFVDGFVNKAASKL